jgi:DNA-binding beta-propeller fold protein YncE
VAVSSAPRHLRFAEPGGPLLVPAEKSGELDVISIPAGEVVERVSVGRQPHDAVQADGLFFVTNEFSDTVSVVEAGRVIANLPGPAQPGGIAAVSNRVCVVGVRSHLLDLFDASSLQRIAGALAGVGPTHAAADANTCYIVDTAGNAILAFRTAPSLDLASSTALPGRPYGVALDPERNRLWVTETSNNTLAELLLGDSGPKLVAVFPSVREPNSVAVDAATGRVFVTGTGDGVIQILDPSA